MIKRKREKDTKARPSLDLLVDKPEAIARNCARRIEAVLGTKGIGFNRRDIYRRKVLFFLTYSSRIYGSRAYDKKRDLFYPVIPLYPSNIEGNSYWLAVSLIFSPVLAQYRLEEVRLYVFMGSISDSAKEAFFRAEWDNPTEKNNKHAQPHWHVYRNVPDTESVKEEIADFQPLTVTEEVKDFGEHDTQLVQTKELPKEKEVPFEKFHFAMASSWHLNDEHQTNFETEQSLFDWLSRCISYIREELQ